jgi:hypothetical protein
VPLLYCCTFTTSLFSTVRLPLYFFTFTTLLGMQKSEAKRKLLTRAVISFHVLSLSLSLSLSLTHTHTHTHTHTGTISSPEAFKAALEPRINATVFTTPLYYSTLLLHFTTPFSKSAGSAHRCHGITCHRVPLLCSSFIYIYIYIYVYIYIYIYICIYYMYICIYIHTYI